MSPSRVPRPGLPPLKEMGALPRALAACYWAVAATVAQQHPPPPPRSHDGPPPMRTIRKTLAHMRPSDLRRLHDGGSACSAPGAAPTCKPDACPGGQVTVSCPAAASGRDCGPQLQQALDSCCPLVTIPALPSNASWMTNSSLCIRSNTKVVFSAGTTVVAGRGGFKDYVAPLFWVAGSTLATSNISNVTIVGHGARWKMWKEDYDTPSLGYVHSEARPGLYMYRCKDCSVFGLTVEGSGGDGMVRIVLLTPNGSSAEKDRLRAIAS